MAEMNNMAKKCLYLVSSSSSREYVADCLEALALPRGMIMHFRYRLRYVDDDLVNSLPQEGAELGEKLQGLPIVVVYVYQTQTGGVWAPVETEERGGPYLPLRCGRLVNAFKDGEIAHFFFEVTGYVKEDKDESNRKSLNKKVDFRTRAKYAHVAEDLSFDSPETDDTAGFQGILDNAYWPNEWRTRSLGSAPLDVTYEIVSFRISGVFYGKENRFDLVRPIQRFIGSNVYSAYQLDPGGTYHLRVSTHLPYRSPATLPGQGQVTLRLDFNADLIKPLGPIRLRVNSFYDLEYWSFFVANADAQQSALTVACEYNVSVDRSEFQRTEVLCPEISLPIIIRSGTSPRQVDIK